MFLARDVAILTQGGAPVNPRLAGVQVSGVQVCRCPPSHCRAATVGHAHPDPVPRPDVRVRCYPARVHLAPAPRLLLPVLLFSFALTAQDEQQPQDTFGHSRHGAEFDEGPRQAAYLMAGMSSQVHFPVPGLGDEAQRFFDQGICQQHGFWYFEAERSFRQVAMLQPDCALAYLGMCIANVEHPKRASGFAAQAVQRAAALPERERRWVDAWARFHQITVDDAKELQSGDQARIDKARAAIVERSQNRDERKLGRELVRDLEAIVAAAPDDAEAKAFLIVQVWRNTEVGLEITSHGAVDALLDQLFALAPLHPAHHFRVHLWDHEKPERALSSAATLGQTAPGIAHQWHMGGHIFDRLGRWADAAWQQEASARVDHAFMARDRVLPYEIHNYGHNQEWLCRSLSACGRLHDAVLLAQNMIELPRHPRRNRVAADEDIAGYGRARLLEVLESYECWDEVVRLCSDGHVEPTDDRGEQLRRLQALGTAHFRRGDGIAGARVLTEVETLRDQLRADRGKAIDVAEDAAWSKHASAGDAETAVTDAAKKATEQVLRAQRSLHQLRGEQWLQKGDGKQALAEFEQSPNTPPWPRALAHLQLGERDDAVRLLQNALGEHPRVPTLARLVFALHAAGNAEWRQRFAELQRLAGTADLDAPLLARLAPLAQECGAPADWRLPSPPASDVGTRPDLAALGPFRWQPQPALPLDVALADGGRFVLADHRGHDTLLVFYLGSGCVHCVEQLRALQPRLDAFAAAGIDVVAIGTEPPQKAAALQRSLATAAATAPAVPAQDPLPLAGQPPLRLAADPELAAFRAWRANDDFERMPLHATVLGDREGRVRWQDVGFEPFREIDWLLGECRRLLALPAVPAGER